MRFLNCSWVDTTQIPNYVNEYSFFSISNLGNYLNIIQVKVYSISIIFLCKEDSFLNTVQDEMYTYICEHTTFWKIGVM